jgi:hypothetical protein
VRRVLRWLDDHVDPEARRIAAAWLLLGCLIGWPVSQLTWARHEPPTVLALSWAAMILAAVGILATADARKAVDE